MSEWVLGLLGILVGCCVLVPIALVAHWLNYRVLTGERIGFWAFLRGPRQ